MYTTSVASRQRWPLALASLALAAGPLFASEHGAPPAVAVHEPVAASAAAAPAHPPAAESHASSPAAREAAPAAHLEAAEDPMDRLRERLARKLGAAKPPGAENPNLLRIVAKPGIGAHSDADLLVTTPSQAHAALARRALRARPVTPVAVAFAEHAAAPSGVDPGQAHWDYAGTGGPDSWGQLKPEFNKCTTGKRQSPIDIQGGIHVDLDPVDFNYRAGAFRVIDNGHTVQVNVGPGNSIQVLGKRYDLIQFHFHRPSEERIDGRQFDMVVHLVHRDLEGHLAVIAVLLDRGSALPAVQTVWNNLPLEKGEEVVGQTLFNPNELLPVDRSYYTYMGSLTTPPCSEGVLWMVMKAPMPISAQQVGIFSRLYPMNARPIQASAGRLIKESN